MTAIELTQRSLERARSFDRVWMVVIALILAIMVFDWANTPSVLGFAFSALANTAPYMLFAVLAIGFLKATGAETLVAKAFQGQEKRMIVVAALVGGLAPFCSCEIIPFIAGLLAVGTPLSAVMALWLSSPLMDPSIFVITAGELGWNFAVAKTVIAVSLGLIGGFTVYFLTRGGAFQDVVLKRKPGGCCGVRKPFEGEPVWKFWHQDERRAVFVEESRSNGLFLLKWLSLAYVIEALMVHYVPAETIASIVGGTGLWPIVLSAAVGAPAYLNGYAAPAIVSGLMDHGMTGGAAMAFVIAGGITSIPAMTAVFALVKKPVFATYLALGFSGAILSGVGYSAFLAYAL